MKVDVVYVYPQVIPRIYFPLAKRFATTYTQFPAGFDHTLNVVCNGGAPSEIAQDLFADIPCRLHARSNLGWDIGAYQWAAETLKCDMLVCMGAPIHFYKPGWLERMADVFVEHGPNLYGCWAYESPATHVRTTVFWCHPELLRSYPWIVGNARPARYAFEHGKDSFTRWTLKAGLRALMVTWTNVWDHPWKDDKMPHGIGDCLCLDQFTHR